MSHPGQDASESEWSDTSAITRGSAILAMIYRAAFPLATALLTLLYRWWLPKSNTRSVGAIATLCPCHRIGLDTNGLALNRWTLIEMGRLAFSDDLLFIRYLFGFSGDALISGAVGENAQRTTTKQIQAYISECIPAT